MIAFLSRYLGGEGELVVRRVGKLGRLQGKSIEVQGKSCEGLNWVTELRKIGKKSEIAFKNEEKSCKLELRVVCLSHGMCGEWHGSLRTE